MRLTVLASGSKGNSAVVATERTRILVDAGLSCRELLRRMRLAGEDPERLSAILVTHEHQDHVAGLGVLARKLRIPVFLTEGTHRAWVRMLTPRTTMSYAEWLDRLARERDAKREGIERARSLVPDYSLARVVSPEHDGEAAAPDPVRLTAVAAISAEVAALAPSHGAAANMASTVNEPPCDPSPAAELIPSARTGRSEVVRSREADPTFLPAVEYFRSGKRFSIGDIEICPFTIPHDAADPCGFVFFAEGLRFGLATDLGYMPPNVKSALRDLDLLLLESNHDLEMLRDGPYPWSVKQRVLSRVGHLSNLACADFLEHDYDGGAHTVVLAHLSESNNVPELARLAAEEAIGDRMRLLGNRVVLARQDAPLEPICL